MAPLFTSEKITEEEFAALEDAYDDIEQPPGPYTVQPNNQGRKSKMEEQEKHYMHCTTF